MEHPLIFTRDKETYYYVGQPADYFYDFGMIPISTNACSDVLEKNRFLVAIFEYFRDFIILEENALIPKEIIQDIKLHFKDYDSFDLSHWNLLAYEIMDKESADEDFDWIEPAAVVVRHRQLLGSAHDRCHAER